jgi:hypothetical protein
MTEDSNIDFTRLQSRSAVLAEAENAKDEEARSYLAATDWMVLRHTELGKPVPSAVTLKRQQARAQISKAT